MTCSHLETFDCHGTLRCSSCYLDSYQLADGTRFWPAQENPSEWSDRRVADWFLAAKIHQLPQGCDGFTFCRTPSPGATYGYVWVTTVLDLDYRMAWLLDVRCHDGTTESRHFIFVGSGLGKVVVSSFGSDDLISGLHWFADQTAAWLQGDRRS